MPVAHTHSERKRESERDGAAQEAVLLLVLKCKWSLPAEIKLCGSNDNPSAKRPMRPTAIQLPATRTAAPSPTKSPGRRNAPFGSCLLKTALTDAKLIGRCGISSSSSSSRSSSRAVAPANCN